METGSEVGFSQDLPPSATRPTRSEPADGVSPAAMVEQKMNTWINNMLHKWVLSRLFGQVYYQSSIICYNAVSYCRLPLRGTSIALVVIDGCYEPINSVNSHEGLALPSKLFAAIAPLRGTSIALDMTIIPHGIIKFSPCFPGPRMRHSEKTGLILAIYTRPKIASVYTILCQNDNDSRLSLSRTVNTVNYHYERHTLPS